MLLSAATLSFQLAADYEQSSTVRVTAALALPSATRCVFDGGIETACTAAAEPTVCTCETPASPGVIGDVPLALLASNGTLLSNGSLTYYAPGEPPTIVSSRRRAARARPRAPSSPWSRATSRRRPRSAAASAS